MEQDRLRRCSQCGELKGEALVEDPREGSIYRRVLCLCDGIVCRYCRTNAIHRPISNWYDEQTGRVWYVSSDGWLFPCRECRRRLGAGPGESIRLPAPGSMRRDASDTSP